MKQKSFWILAFSVGMIPLAIAQQYVYPAKGQSPQQQQSDESACYSWAVQQTGFDPAKQQPAAKPATTATGTTPGAGARGAVRGAVVGEVVGGDVDRLVVRARPDEDERTGRRRIDCCLDGVEVAGYGDRATRPGNRGAGIHRQEQRPGSFVACLPP